MPKVVNFSSELEVHYSLLTVLETFVFAFRAATGGHHAYGQASSPESAAFLNSNMDDRMTKVSVSLFVSLFVCLSLCLAPSLPPHSLPHCLTH